MKRFIILAAVAALLIIPAASFAEPPKPGPAPAPAAQPAPPPEQPKAKPQSYDDIDWLSEFGLGGDPTGPAAGQRPNEEQRDRMRHDRHEALERMRRDDPKRYNRLMKIRRLAINYRRADSDKERAAIEKELRPLVDAELRIQHENNQKRIDDMERRIHDAKKVLDEREENWDKVVDFTVKEITGQNAYLRAVHRHDRNRRQR